MRMVFFGLRFRAWALLLCLGLLCGGLATGAGAEAGRSAVVVLDPGHGGVDPGAVDDVNGILEKTINLAVAQKMRARLEAAGHRVVMTGGGGAERWISLDERVAVANDNEADVFVSIHANSFHDRTCAGAEVFYHRASEEGRVLAGMFQSVLQGARPPVTCRVKPSDYFVLRGTRMPAVLVEMGYITNDDEAKRLLAPAYQDKLAEAFATAVDRYLE